MKNPFEREIKLRQHTPIIHFQHDQFGATLRATELKPKLDKFIIKKHFNDDFSKFKNFLVGFTGKESREEIHPAINYKVNISIGKKSLRREKYRIITENKTGISSEEIFLKIFSFNKDLKNIVEQYLKDFFVLHNFGLGQSKGFGGFTTNDTSQTDFETILQNHYKVFFKKEIQGNIKNYQDIYNEIKREYQLLKSGINFKGYEKSKLFQFMCKRDIQWEKRKIKETIKNKHKDVFDALMYDERNSKENRIMRCREKDDELNFKYIRALLGLAEHNEYRTFNSPHKNKSMIKKVKININDQKGEIERFQSPIFFKVFNKTIYILPNPVPKEMFNRIFEFYLELDYGESGKKEFKEPLFTIPTPNKNEFDLKAFLDYSLSRDKNWQRIEKK